MSATDLSAALSNSLSLSSILILTALGLAITFGVMRVINMAHGDLLMLGAYTAFVVTSPLYFGKNLYWAIPISFVVVGLVGYLLEICMVRFLYGRPLDTLLATWGVGMILQQAVKLAFGANLQALHQPEELQSALVIGDLSIPRYRIFIVGITVICLLGVYLWFYRTSFGLKIRAVVQNRSMASALGISTRQVDSITFAFASGLAGVGGCVLAYLDGVSFTMGSKYIVEAFMVVILGGVGQLGGSVAGGLLMGFGKSFVNKVITSTWMITLVLGVGISHTVYEKTLGENSESMTGFIVLMSVIGLILLRPSGLFAVRERAYD
jgi:urea transport system permease protein